MLFTIISGLVAAFGPSVTKERLTEISQSQLEKDRYPLILQDDFREKSFAGQDQTSVRLPFGPNPHEHEINAWAMLDKDKYKKLYQKHIHNTRVDNQHFLLDSSMTGPVNTFHTVHNPENSFQDISNFWNQRSQEIGNS